jgi:hypothetical protein
MKRTGDQVSTPELEKALRSAAYLVEKHGEEFIPFFVRLEDELKARRANSDVRARARALLQQQAGL